MMYICNGYDKLRCGTCGGGKPHKHSTIPTPVTCERTRNKVVCIPVDCLLPDYLFRIDGMEHKTERMLGLLEKQLSKCRKCDIHINGQVKPFWTPDYKGMAIVSEAPGREDVNNNTPFSCTDNILMEVLSKYDIHRDHCFIINTVNCRPVEGLKNRNPSALEMEMCKPWMNKYFGVLKPKKVLLLGNHALGSILGESGVVSKNNTTTVVNGITYVRSVHPAYAIYNRSSGLQMLENSVKSFAEAE